MKKIIFLLFISIFLVSCKENPSKQQVWPDPVHTALTQEEEEYFSNLFKPVKEISDFSFDVEDLVDIYLGEKFGMMKFYSFEFRDINSTRFRTSFHEKEKEGCTINIDIPSEVDNFANDEQLDFTMELFEAVYKPTKEEFNSVYDYLNEYYIEGNISQIGSVNIGEYNITQNLAPNPDPNETGGFVILSIKLIGTMCV